MSPICPCCGHNLEAELPIMAGRFAYSPAGGFLVDGERLKVQPRCHAMIGAIMAAGGAVVRREALAERQGDEYAQPFPMINMMAHYLRRALDELGVEPPFKRVPCTGLRWTGPEVERIAA